MIGWPFCCPHLSTYLERRTWQGVVNVPCLICHRCDLNTGPVLRRSAAERAEYVRAPLAHEGMKATRVQVPGKVTPMRKRGER